MSMKSKSISMNERSSVEVNDDYESNSYTTPQKVKTMSSPNKPRSKTGKTLYYDEPEDHLERLINRDQDYSDDDQEDSLVKRIQTLRKTKAMENTEANGEKSKRTKTRSLKSDKGLGNNNSEIEEPEMESKSVMKSDRSLNTLNGKSTSLRPKSKSTNSSSLKERLEMSKTANMVDDETKPSVNNTMQSKSLMPPRPSSSSPQRLVRSYNKSMENNNTSKSLEDRIAEVRRNKSANNSLEGIINEERKKSRSRSNSIDNESNRSPSPQRRSRSPSLAERLKESKSMNYSSGNNMNRGAKSSNIDGLRQIDTNDRTRGTKSLGANPKSPGTLDLLNSLSREQKEKRDFELYGNIMSYATSDDELEFVEGELEMDEHNKIYVPLEIKSRNVKKSKMMPSDDDEAIVKMISNGEMPKSRSRSKSKSKTIEEKEPKQDQMKSKSRSKSPEKRSLNDLLATKKSKSKSPEMPEHVDFLQDHLDNLRKLEFKIIEKYSYIDESKSLMIPVITRYGNHAMVLVNVPENHLQYIETDKILTPNDKKFPFAEKALEVINLSSYNDIGVYFELFSRAVLMMRNKDKTENNTMFFNVSIEEDNERMERIPIPVVKYESLMQDSESVENVLLEIDNCYHNILAKHINRVASKNKTISDKFSNVISKPVKLIEGIQNAISDFNSLSQAEIDAINNLHNGSFTNSIYKIKYNDDDSKTESLCVNKQNIQNRILMMVGKLRQLNRIKLLQMKLASEIANFNTNTIGFSMISEAEDFAEISGVSLQSEIDKINSHMM